MFLNNSPIDFIALTASVAQLNSRGQSSSWIKKTQTKYVKIGDIYWKYEIVNGDCNFRKFLEILDRKVHKNKTIQYFLICLTVSEKIGSCCPAAHVLRCRFPTLSEESALSPLEHNVSILAVVFSVSLHKNFFLEITFKSFVNGE